MEAPAFIYRTFTGLALHARTIIARALDPVTGKFTPKKFRNDPRAVTAWVRSLPRPVSVVHEAGPTGYTLARHFEEAGLCVCVCV